jgi:hypothetical protein
MHTTLQVLREMLCTVRATELTTHGNAKLKVLALSEDEAERWGNALSAVLIEMGRLRRKR